ncbi:MAG: DUF554 domain-containing protein [Lachnospiraceae bacterium]|nr:DUF554 domain-containing protein [Lachnospiraceae bacterium]
MLGTIVNVVLVLLGSIIGLVIKGGIKERYKLIVMDALALSVLFVGAASALGGMMSEDANPMLFIVCLAVGALIGEWIGIEAILEKIGDTLQTKLGNGEGNIAQGFVTASLTFCVGSMAILGSFESGIQGVHTTLITKGLLDFVASIIFASGLGVGVAFSAVSVFVYQGALTMFASFLQPFLTADMIREISIVGGIMIFGLGLNMLGVKKIKTANMLPALVIPVVYYLPFVQRIVAMVTGLI